ncbi:MULTISPECIES: XisH family protein [Oscillatoriales]|jgi:hypothetical protein|uniref:FdxN element excision controlling factor protein n=1 Tax=Limnospira platensis NIES-46 TaxID=1236695 RepID=A0A5M3T280_LIMPL|nr:MULTISPECIES: XisH family protein [Arthrospira]AMW30745.1 fatty-acid synthase [Arthrospira platensis YZ]KDR55129.1 fatty-acid synthase [Arthrospira platensis str. Paraca]MDF2207241.1 XisH family protein [Arthrospira platensis NCB002]MDT9185648.1 XisH family protein [Limnospira sp. PMC 289.06]MDT9298082.1 XisH family protein [Arthrospira platensis PCC 7345]MDT9313662.1 XisH family protein [Limnospira sp. Paracas R14]QQW28666.1 XisH family protein [Arthrospira sp. PCC 9108]BAI93546.1 fdxN 
MPRRDTTHNIIKQAIIKDGWEITDDPYVISYGERFLFVDLGVRRSHFPTQPKGSIIGARRDRTRIAIEIKEFRGLSAIADLEQAIGQYSLYRLLLNEVDPERHIYLGVTDIIYETIFSETIGKLVINKLPLNLLVVDGKKAEVKQWIP